MFGYNLPDAAQFMLGKSFVPGQRYRFQPEFSFPSISCNVNMHRFAPVGCVEKEAVRAFSQYNRHALRPSGWNIESPPQVWG